MKIIIFDSSTIINFTMNGLLDLFRNLNKVFPGKFIIPREVRHETVDVPMNNKEYELGALKVAKLIEDHILEMPEIIGINSEDIRRGTQEILKQTNRIFSSDNQFIHMIDEGEASCLALSQMLKAKKIDNAVAVDERTTRMLGEMPENLHKLLERKFHAKIQFNKNALPDISGIKFVRSSELVYVAWKKGLYDFKDSRTLGALLYATKFKGSAISWEEIEEVKKL